MIYLDNAATTYPKPRTVPRAVYQSFRRYGANPGRAGHELSLSTAEQVYRCRKMLAEMFGASGPDQVVFTLNCTYALNMALKGLLRQGDHVITSDLEHNAVMRPLEQLRRDGVITYSVAHVTVGNPAATISAFEREIRLSTRLIVCTHVSNVFGVILPVEQIGALARRRELYFVLDCAQSAGVLPIRMQQMHANCLCMPGHKGLYGPMGTGVLLCSTDTPMRTLIEGGTGSLSKNLEQPDILPDRFESGTVNVPGIVGLRAGVEFVRARGMEAIHRHELGIAGHVYQGLASISGVQLYTPAPREGVLAPVISFNVKGLGSEQAAARLNDSGIAVRAGLHCAPAAHRAFHTLESGTVRVSPGAFNTEHDASILIKSVFQIAKSRK